MSIWKGTTTLQFASKSFGKNIAFCNANETYIYSVNNLDLIFFVFLFIVHFQIPHDIYYL